MLLRSVIPVLSAPIVYGAIRVPVNWLIVKLFPEHFDERWITMNKTLLVVLVSLTILFAGASGFVGVLIARCHMFHHVSAIRVLQLGIGIAVQRQYWDTLPLWYHLAFFTLLIAGIFLGAWLRPLVVRTAQ